MNTQRPKPHSTKRAPLRATYSVGKHRERVDVLELCPDGDVWIAWADGRLGKVDAARLRLVQP